MGMGTIRSLAEAKDDGGVPDRAPCFYPTTPAPRGAAVPLPIASGDREETRGTAVLTAAAVRPAGPAAARA